MLREIFLGRNPSHFHVNAVVKVFIMSELFLWSGVHFILPIFALFAISLPGGNVEIAATAYSTHLVARIIFELTSGRYFSAILEKKKFSVIIIGMAIMSVGYIGFAFTTTVSMLYIFYAVLGMGLGLASPVKNSLFSTHLDKDKETMEWGMLDAIVFTFIALASALGGFIVHQYGFQMLFILAAIVNAIGILPYLLYLKEPKPQTFTDHIRQRLFSIMPTQEAKNNENQSNGGE